MNANIPTRDTGRNTWFTVLGVCTLWLVVQNAVLMAIASVLHPELAVGLAVGMVRALAHMVAAGGQALTSIAAGLPAWLSSGVLITLNGGLL